MNVLILTASTGGGHKRAAAAIEAKIKEISPDTTVNVVDALEKIGKVYNKTVCEGYYLLATKTPKFYGTCYKITDRKNLIYKSVMRSNSMMSNKLLKLFEQYKPDVVIACHAFVTTMISRLRKHGKTNVKAISLITDYDAHRTYFAPNIDAYVVAEPYMAKTLEQKYNIPAEKIYPYGIPILDKFSVPQVSKEEICKRERLDPSKRTILFMAGSFGVTGVTKFYEKLAQKKYDAQFIVITGKNAKLFEKIEALESKQNSGNKTKLLYFVDNVEDYMHISDLIITKPGGLTVTESLACHLPMAIYSAFPGQEKDNANFLVSQNVAILLDEDRGVDQITELINEPEKLEQMKENCKRLAQPNSAEKIFRLAEKLIDENA